ncbi:hypothetical protein L249_2307 [Ophiocordyceps polyrhachis-furcata BCC 54312]|uniref:Peptidase M43 pregnancy-associated plasma-A domain-containing protein n=1 Tax=Ophiocordyceps polyrhachis-furcata BCC 54312 TaxID=1330021 RepID=A0A367LRL0_9HYPO|nr:hypothetical protein L249_2307 [Ophiocordyceps polyrhachis-furcata BCC 54312]
MVNFFFLSYFVTCIVIVFAASPPKKHRPRRKAIQVPDFPPIQIDVHAHIYVKKESTHRLTRRALDKQMVILNGAFHDIRANFVLQTAEWIVDDRWAVGVDLGNMSFENYQGNYSALNIHIVEHLGPPFRDKHGLCSIPFAGSFIDDSCVFSAYNIPDGPGSDSPLLEDKPLGKVMIHGVGHWFGLHHPSRGLCHGYTNRVPDLPVMLNVEGCPAWGDTCPQQPGYDPIHNYMVYASTEKCKAEFTPGQLVRMRHNWDTYRAKGRRRTSLELTRLRMLRQTGKLPYFVAPSRTSVDYKIMTMLCSPDRNGVYRELREDYCGTAIYCRNELFRIANGGGGADAASMSWRECLSRRTDTDDGFEG